MLIPFLYEPLITSASTITEASIFKFYEISGLTIGVCLSSASSAPLWLQRDLSVELHPSVVGHKKSNGAVHACRLDVELRRYLVKIFIKPLV